MSRICPKCRADLASVHVRNGKLRCPKCAAFFSLGRSDDRLQKTPAASRHAAPQKPSAVPMVLILTGLGLGLVGLLAIGGIVGFLYFRSPTTTPIVASAPSQASDNAAPPAPLNPEPAKEPIQPVKSPAGGNNTLPLTELKAATVYIQQETATMLVMGSGFVVHAQGATVHVITNHHVISQPAEKARQPQRAPGPQMPVRPVPRPPFGPRMPIGPRLPRRRMAGEMPFRSPAAKLTVVFYSGTAKEQALPAILVGDDAAHDLAILRVVGVRDVPRPINYQSKPELRETMPVVMFGFPLGRLLDGKKKYPAITVTKGNVSSLRGGGDEMDKVQLDIDMNPGNSGGPVVDESGGLIGVAYSGLDNTHINFAIPVYKLNGFLQGRIDPPTMLELLTVGGRQQIRVRASAADPFGKLRSPRLLYGLASHVRMPQKGPNGWSPLSGGESSELILEGAQAIATLPLTAPVSGQLQIIAQVSYQDAMGKAVNGEPRLLRLEMAKLPPPIVAGPTPPARPAPSPIKPPIALRAPKGEELAKVLADLKSVDEDTRQRAASILQRTQALKSMDAKLAENALLPLLADSNVLVRCAAARMLADVGSRDSIAPLEKLAKENDVFHSALARQAIASIKDRNRMDRTTPSAKIDERASAAKTPGLIAYWSFEEGQGERAADASGNGLNATLVQAVWTVGIRGKALRLSGPNSYLDYGDSSRLSFAARASFAIAFWTRTIRAKGTLLSQRHSRHGGAIIDLLIADGRAKAQVRQDGNDIFGPTEILSGTINDGNWHHLCLTRDGDRIELFLDGVSQGQKSGNLSGGAITTDLRALGAERYWLKHFSFGDPHFEGDMDEFCIFDRVLKANEIAALALR